MSASSSSKKLAKSLFELYPTLRSRIEYVQSEIFGQTPYSVTNLNSHTRSGFVFGKKQLTGVYLNQYYMDPIAKFARKVIPGFKTELEERQSFKLMQMKRRGKGPPKKGAGSRSKKKK